MGRGRLEILVVDDSALMRRALTQILEDIPGAVVRTARNGREALDAVREYEPDVVTLDVNMPEMDGLTCLSHIMTQSPRPVVMVSSITSKDSEATLEALSMGAVEVIEKPDGTVSKRLEVMGGRIRAVVESAVRARPRLTPRAAAPALVRAKTRRAAVGLGDRLILVGVSTGGPAALEAILPQLPADLPMPVVIAQHMPGTFTRSFAERLDARCALRVVEADDLTPLEPGTAYILHGGGDGVVECRLGRVVVRPVEASPQHTWHPSADRLVASALQHLAPKRLLGVLLTGMGDDGARAMAELHAKGGWTIAEAESSAVVYGMPRALVERGGASEVRDLSMVARSITAWAARKD